MSPALTQLIERLCERLNGCIVGGGHQALGPVRLAEKAAAEILAAELEPLVEDQERLERYLCMREAELDSEIVSEDLGCNSYKEAMARRARSEITAIRAAIDADRAANRQTQPNAKPNQKEQP